MDLEAQIRAIVREEVARAIASIKPRDELLTTAQAAEVAKVTVGSVQRWVATGKLKRRHAGRQLRVSRRELEEMLLKPRDGDELSPEELADRKYG